MRLHERVIDALTAAFGGPEHVGEHLQWRVPTVGHGTPGLVLLDKGLAEAGAVTLWWFDPRPARHADAERITVAQPEQAALAPGWIRARADAPARRAAKSRPPVVPAPPADLRETAIAIISERLGVPVIEARRAWWVLRRRGDPSGASLPLIVCVDAYEQGEGAGIRLWAAGHLGSGPSVLDWQTRRPEHVRGFLDTLMGSLPDF